MTKRNDQGREIWFERVMWSYVPAHWKGVIFPAINNYVCGAAVSGG